MTWLVTLNLLALALYGWSVIYRAKLFTWTKFCHDATHCRRKHRVVIVAPPRKPLRVVLKHV